MATLPLYTPVPPTADAGASRRVIAPGGFEAWHVHAHGRGGDGKPSVTVVADFYAGYPFHADYLAAYARYRRRPTRVAPPAPRDFACVSVAVYEADRPAAGFLCHADAGQFEASAERLDVRLAGNALVRQPDGSIRLTAAAAAPAGVAVDLVFCPRVKCRVVHRAFAGLGPDGVEYHWGAGEPLFDVAGDVRLDPARTLRLEGLGYHDYVFTTGPLAPGVRRWSRSRVLFDDRALVAHHAIPVRRGLPVMALAAEGSAGEWGEPDAVDGRAEDPAASDRAASLVPLDLAAPDVDHRAGPVRRMTYDVRLDGRPGRALCETTYPSRWYRPLLGRWALPHVPRCRVP